LVAVDWHGLWIPSGSLVELILRTSMMYLVILAGFRVFRRDAGSLNVSDLLVVVLIADAAQNGMSAEYRSVTEGVVVVATIFAWNFALDWLAYHSRLVYWLLHAESLLLIKDGRIQARNLRAQLLTTKLKPLHVPGGYFQLVDYSVVSDLDDLAFCRWLTTEHGVAAIPLSPFYESPPQGQRLARLCFAKNEATLDAAIARLQRL
jgi:hypothetical protein